MPELTPKQLQDWYDNGFKGSFFEPDHYEHFMQSLPMPYFGEVCGDIRDSGKGKLSTPFKSVLFFDKDAYEEKQVTGDCVSHGTRNAVDVSRAVQIHLKGALESWMARGATEAIYGCRGHGGQGMSCSRATEFVNKLGGVAIRKNYEGVVDLTKYQGMLGAGWGGRGGVPAALVAILKQNQVKTVSLIRSVEEARDAIANGYGVCCCSGQGFSSTRDSNGFARAQGSWSHAMAWTACDDASPRKGFMIQQSWGKWNSGGDTEWGLAPGAFMAEYDVCERMIRGGGTFAYSNVVGFPAQKLPDYGTSSYL